MHLRAALVFALVVLAGCASRERSRSANTPDQTSDAPESSTPDGVNSIVVPSTEKGGGEKLSRKDAEKYLLGLINRDRAAHGLPTVKWDETAARAGQAHADDMVRNGFTAHWGSDGSVPELRYTRAGGAHMVQENAGCFADGKARELDPDPRFDTKAIERVQSAFYNETPPNDGHRKNILKRWHTHVGVGLAKARGVDVVCQAQEFTDMFGAYSELPKTARLGQNIRVLGSVTPPAKFVGVGVARTDLPSPRTAAALLRLGTYPIPKPFVNYFPAGFVTPKPVTVRGNTFSIDVPLADGRKKGLYEVSVWAEVPGAGDFVMVSLRTIEVR